MSILLLSRCKSVKKMSLPVLKWPPIYSTVYFAVYSIFSSELIFRASYLYHDVFWQNCWKTSTSVVGDIVEGIVQMTIQVWNFAKRFIKPCYWKRNCWPQKNPFFQDGYRKYFKHGRFYLAKSLNLSKPDVKLYWNLNFK